MGIIYPFIAINYLHFFFYDLQATYTKRLKGKTISPKHCFNIKRKSFFIYLAKAFFEIRSSL